MSEAAGTAGTGRVDTVRLQMLAQAYQRSAALFAAVEVDLFTAVEKGGRQRRGAGGGARDLAPQCRPHRAGAARARPAGAARRGSRQCRRRAALSGPGRALLCGALDAVHQAALDRMEAVAGDFTRDAFPPDCDAAVMASNLPQYDAAIIAEVIARTFAALAPGGEMHLIGEMLDDDGSGPIGPALWGLSEALFHSTGRAHIEAECLGYFRAAGFVDLAVRPFIPGVLTRVTGRKPA